MNYIDEIVEKRADNFKRFSEALNKNDSFFPIKYDHIQLVSNFAVAVICKSKEIFKKYIKIFEDNQIEIRPIVGGDMTQQIFWKELYGENTKQTNAKYIHEN